MCYIQYIYIVYVYKYILSILYIELLSWGELFCLLLPMGTPRPEIGARFQNKSGQREIKKIRSLRGPEIDAPWA